MANRYGLAIRSADVGDVEGIDHLLQTAGMKVDGHGLADRLQAIPEQAGAVLLAVEWGPPSGIIALNWNWTLTDEMKIASVTMLLVDPEQRRRGIARVLLKTASQLARTSGCGELRLTPAMPGDYLHAFCLATGFAETGHSLARPLRKRA